MIDHILTDILVGNTVVESKSLAMSIHNSIEKGLASKRIKNRGLRPALFYVLALSKVPGVLLEAGFISNQEDLKNLTNEKFQELYAKLVAKGIINYLNLKK